MKDAEFAAEAEAEMARLMTVLDKYDFLDGLKSAGDDLVADLLNLIADERRESTKKLAENDYVLTDNAAWFTVGPFSVRVRLYEGELKMSAYKVGDEDNERGPYAEAVAYAEDIQDDDPAVQAAATLSPEALADAAREGQELGTCDED